MNNVNQLSIKRAYNFAYRMSGNTEVAKDVTEQALLMGIHNYAYNYNCNNNNPGQNQDLNLLKQVWVLLIKTNGCIAIKEDSSVQQLLLSLSPEARCALILRDLLGYSYGQISAVINKSEIEIGRLISRGRQEIAKSVKKINIIGS